MDGQHGLMNGQHNHDNCMSCCVSSLSWTAVIVGALVGIGLAFLLNLFSVAIGLSVYTTTTAGAMTLAIGGMVGLAIGIIVSMYVAGWVAGYLGRSHCVKRNLGVLYGFTAWCLALLITVMMTANMGRYISTYSHFLSNPTVVTLTQDKMDVMGTTKATANSPVEVVDVVVTAGNVGMGAFIIFILFSLGALASCFGGHCGMSCRTCDSGRCGTTTKP